MTFKITQWSLIVILILLHGVLHAEGRCPPGYHPIGATSGQGGPQGCAPIPGYNDGQQEQQNPSPTVWKDRWGAIAADSPKGILGTATNRFDRNSAESAAIADCQSKQGSSCLVQLSYRNQCAVVVVGDEGYNATKGTTLLQAKFAGLKVCSDADSHCSVYYSDCSLPIQIN